MIAPHFLNGIIDICELIADRPKFAAGLGRSSNPKWTGVPTYDELMSQIFDDLRARESVLSLVNQVEVPAAIRTTIISFVAALDFYGHSNASGEIAFASAEWRFVEHSALAVFDTYIKARKTGSELDN